MQNLYPYLGADLKLHNQDPFSTVTVVAISEIVKA